MKVICYLCHKITEVYINMMVDGNHVAVCRDCINSRNKVREVEYEEAEEEDE